ncbi:MAG: CotH kinase family protein, partial [Planctomycetes bacterium]|nr:CotH kinase family protein [Planctomycetota bacterium]
MKYHKGLKIIILAFVSLLALVSVVRAEIDPATGCPVGDFSGNCIVGFEDYLMLAGQWLDPSCSGFECADLTDSGGVNMADYVLLVNNWGEEVSPLVINEFMAANGGAFLLDGNGNSSDWVEVLNVTQRTFNLDGWYLTDNPGDLTKWAFHGGKVLGPGEFLVVFASGQPTDTYVDPDGYLHTSFKLKAKTEYVALVRPDGETIVSEYGTGGNDYPRQVTDISYGLFDGVERYFANPTPGAANDPNFVEFVADTKFSVDRGFYDASFSVIITSATPGATIRYTTSGSAPTETSGTVYSGPISIATTTTLRAAAFKAGFQPTNVDTQTYIFLSDVITQDGSGLPAFASFWCKPLAQDGNPPDWEMDPEIVTSGPFTDGNSSSFDMIDALLAIPTVSLVMEWDDWFSESSPRGLFTHAKEADNEAWERVVSAEFFTPDGSEEFQINCAVSVIGGSGVSSCKHNKFSLRLKFKEKTDANQDGEIAPGVPTGGPTKLDFPLFGDSPVERFDTLVFDARMNYAWTYHGGVSPTTQRERAQYTRDQYVGDLHIAMGGSSPHGRHVHLYLNGLYWGLYNIHERPDASFASEHLGGDKEDYDVLKHNSNTVVGMDDNPAGQTIAKANYSALFTAAGQDLTNPANYNAILDVLDIDEFIDYMLTNFYVGNTDWAHHNWYASFNRVDPDGKWRYHSWDPEKCLQSGTGDNVTTKNNAGGPTRIHQLLKSSPEYRLRFADHVHKHFFNNGVLTPTGAVSLYRKLLDEVDRAMVGESARWGDNVFPSDPYRREIEWIAERDRLLDTWFPVRTASVLGQLGSSLYPSTVPPVFNQFGGYVPTGFSLTMSNPNGSGTRYYTLNGVDPRLPGGALSSEAIAYTGGFVLGGSTVVSARVLDGSTWSALNKATFAVGPVTNKLRITEIMYHPAQAPAGDPNAEYIELTNLASVPLDLSLVSFTEGIHLTFDGITGGVPIASATYDSDSD